MPVYNNEPKRSFGDLYIHFDIIFPKTLTNV